MSKFAIDAHLRKRRDRTAVVATQIRLGILLESACGRLRREVEARTHQRIYRRQFTRSSRRARHKFGIKLQQMLVTLAEHPIDVTKTIGNRLGPTSLTGSLHAPT